MINYAESIVSYEISAIVSELDGIFDWSKDYKKKGVAPFFSLLICSWMTWPSGFQDSYFPPILNSKFVYNSLLFVSKLVGTLMKSPSVTLTYAVEVIVMFLLRDGLQILIVSLPIFIYFL